MTVAAIMKALVEHLLQEPGLQAAGIPVYTQVPAGAPLPYLCLREIQLQGEEAWGLGSREVKGELCLFQAGESPYATLVFSDAIAQWLADAVLVLESGQMTLETVAQRWRMGGNALLEPVLEWTGRLEASLPEGD